MDPFKAIGLDEFDFDVDTSFKIDMTEDVQRFQADFMDNLAHATDEMKARKAAQIWLDHKNSNGQPNDYEAYGATVNNSAKFPAWKAYNVLLVASNGRSNKLVNVCLSEADKTLAVVVDGESCEKKIQTLEDENSNLKQYKQAMMSGNAPAPGGPKMVAKWVPNTPADNAVNKEMNELQKVSSGSNSENTSELKSEISNLKEQITSLKNTMSAYMKVQEERFKQIGH